MAKQELLDKILSDAKSRAEEIRAEAKAKADALLAAAAEERAMLIDNVRKVSAASAPDVLKRARAMAELEVRKVTLARKQAVLSEAYGKAFETITADKRYPSLLANMIVAAAEAGDEAVFAATDVGRVEKKDVLVAAMKAKKVTASKDTGAFRGGIVLRGEACDKNLTLELELESLRSSGQVKYEDLFN